MQKTPALLATDHQRNDASAPAAPVLTMFPHPDMKPWMIAGQANIIFQGHHGFHSPYSGPNSLHGRGEYKTSLLGTVYTGYAWHYNSRYETDFTGVSPDFDGRIS